MRRTLAGRQIATLLFVAVAIFPTARLGAVSVQEPQRTAQKPGTPRSVLYTNQRYGFRFKLPPSWKGYSIITEEWSENPGTDQRKRLERGPEIWIRHPQWTEANPRQDIPIMVFTLRQWKEGLIVSAAPINPTELGRNSKYVFALPARYNYALPTGFEEVEKIIESKPLKAF